MRLIPDATLAAVTIYQEAEGEPYAGKVAVGEAIRNRMRLGGRDRSVAAVVLEPFQFSGWNTRSANRRRSLEIDTDDPVVQQCVAAWLDSASSNLIHGATLYANLSLVKPVWAITRTKTAEIGNHTFFLEEQLIA